MSWPRERLFAAILALSAPWAVADTITVNTTRDDFANNKLCSLREAVEYFNRGKPEGGFQGCEAPSSDASVVITLPDDPDPYLIEDSAITIRVPQAVAINGLGRSGDPKTVIQVQGAHRAFIVNHNPQYVKPACAFPVSPTCASSPATFDLEDASDSGNQDDYLTTVTAPKVIGQLPARTESPLPLHSYMVRVYAIPAEGDPVEVGKVKVPFANTPIDWTAPLILPPGKVYHLRYTTQVVDTANNFAIEDESPLSTETLTVAVYTPPERNLVRFTLMEIRGGCASLTDCATPADDNTVVVNDPQAAGYDQFSLSYTNGLSGTAGNGGVFFTNEELSLFDVLVRDGEAERGGGIYVSANGELVLEESELVANRADEGAAVYAAASSLSIGASLFRENVLSAPAGSAAVVQVASATIPSGAPGVLVQRSTFSGNTGRALSLFGGLVNGATIVLNSGGGIDFNSTAASVYNSILAGNAAGQDCEQLPGSAPLAVLQNNLVLDTAIGGCPESGNQHVDNQADTVGQLMATLVDGKCASRFGLLCPLASRGGETDVHMPRILDDYVALSDSPVLGKGSTFIGGTEPGACTSTDQRGETRSGTRCDIGAVEYLAVAQGRATNSNGSMTYADPFFSKYLGDGLADETLLSASNCPAGITLNLTGVDALYPPDELAPDPSRVLPDSYRQDVAGCPWVEEAPSRGAVTFASEGNYLYTPRRDFHGFDRFRMRVVTTLSRLNDQPALRSRLVSAQVVVEPDTTMQSSKLSGSVDSWGLLLLGLLGLCWRRGGQA